MRRLTVLCAALASLLLAGMPGVGATESSVPAGRADFPADDSAYHNVSELSTFVVETADDHSAIMRRFVYGQSYEGRGLIAVKISDNPSIDENEPEVLFTHHQHGREPLTVEMAIYIINMLTDGYRTSARIRELVNTREIWILPNLNPDGGEFDIATGTYQSWRKNRQPTPRSGAVGTDLNRNWDYKWEDCCGSSVIPSDNTYRGTAPESAPEVRAAANFVRSRVVGGVQQIKAHIDWHSYAEKIMWPYDYTLNDTAPGMTEDDRSALEALGEHMAAANFYAAHQGSDLSLANGTINDWLWGTYKVFTYLFELGPGPYPQVPDTRAFYPHDEQIAALTEINGEPVLRLLEFADCPYRIIRKEAQYC